MSFGLFTIEPPRLYRIQCRTSFVAQLVKNLPANAEDERITGLSIPEKIPWRRKCQSAQLFLLGKFYGAWPTIVHGIVESKMTEHAHIHM